MNKVKQVTAAIMRAYFDRPIDIREINVTVSDNIDLAIAAIEEMREPTDEMMVKAEFAVPELSSFSGRKDSPSYKAWRAMIDAALAEEKEVI